jgi:hypothetical protein
MTEFDGKGDELALEPETGMISANDQTHGHSL